VAGSEQESARGSFRGETPGIFIVLSGFATSDLSVVFCDARQGGGAYEKTPLARPCSGFSFFAHMFFPGLFPGSVDNRVSVFEKGESARRSRTTERSESVSEEAEKHLDVHFLLTHLCGISHPAWCTFHTILTDAT
jgi:hypothetical protein